ncbi:hypothetical protein AB0D78_20870 [Streptomyces avermitilis]
MLRLLPGVAADAAPPSRPLLFLLKGEVLPDGGAFAFRIHVE